MPNDPDSPEALVARTQILDVLVQEWANLDAPYAETLRLRFEEGLTAREIGERLDCPTNTASWRIREGVTRLRARLDERFGDRRHWLGALVAVPGVTGGVPKAAATTTYPMKTITILAIAATAVTITTVAANAADSDDTPAAAEPSPSAADARTASGADTAVSTRSTRAAMAALPANPAGQELVSPGRMTAAAEPPVGYGVMIETAGSGMEACGEEIGELSTIGREVYAGCAEDAGFDPHAKFSMNWTFALVDGTQIRTAGPVGDESGAAELASCMEAQLFGDEMDLEAFSGSLTFAFRPLGPDEESAVAIAGRASARPAEAFPELDVSWRGDAKAPMAVLQCIDPDCPFTRRAAPAVDRLLDEHDGEVRVAQLQQPLAMHEGARRKSRALIAAESHGKYWDAADYLHTHPGVFGDTDYRALAADLDLDPAGFLRELDSEDTVAALAMQEDACEAAGSHGTPTFFVEGHRMPGAVPYEALEALVEQQRD